MGNEAGAGRNRLARPELLTRLRHTRYARPAAVTLLAVAAGGQAVAQAAALTKAAVPGGLDGHVGSTAVVATEYVLPLGLLALLATVPLGVYRPLMAAVAVTLGNAVALASYGQVTVAGCAAELIAVYWLGLAGGPDRGWAFLFRCGAVQRAAGRGGARRGGAVRVGASRVGAGSPNAVIGRCIGAGLALPFLGVALAGGGRAAILLASLVPVAAGTGIAVWAGRLAQTWTEAGAALADTLLAHTARGERARIARELHDVVAHHISMIAVLSETGRLATPGLPEAGARRFLEIGDTARAGLTEMRRLLGVLREDAAVAEPGAAGPAPAAGGGVLGADEGVLAAGGGVLAAGGAPGAGGVPGADGMPGAGGGAPASRQPQPGLAQIAGLIDAAREASVAGTRLIISGQVAPLDPGVELAAYRIVQEALTNARRHAPGAAVDVELRYSPEALRVRVRDNGPGPVTAANGTAADGGAGGDEGDGSGQVPGPPGRQPGGKQPAPQPPGGGHGLLGMRERAFSVGGALYVGAAPGGGFLVEAVLPSEPDPVRSSPRAAVPAPAAGTAGTPAGTGGER